MDINNQDGTVGKRKKNRKNNSRKHRRQYRYHGVSENKYTLYRTRGSREKNKARRAVQRERRLSILRKRYGVHFEDKRRPEDTHSYAEGSGSP